jgi:hypothetical protein
LTIFHDFDDFDDFLRSKISFFLLVSSKPNQNKVSCGPPKSFPSILCSKFAGVYEVPLDGVFTFSLRLAPRTDAPPEAPSLGPVYIFSYTSYEAYSNTLDERIMLTTEYIEIEYNIKQLTVNPISVPNGQDIFLPIEFFKLQGVNIITLDCKPPFLRFAMAFHE